MSEVALHRRAVDDEAGLRAIALLTVDPELARYIPAAELDQARRAVRLPLVSVRRGPFPADAMRVGTNPFGAMIVSGLVEREVRSLGHPTLRLLGPGDLIHAPGFDGSLICRVQSLSAAQPTALAILDDHLLQAVRRWPRLLPALLERASENHDSTILQLAISQQPRVEDRLVVLFRMLAERWGRMTGAGIVLPLALTHESLGRLIGARRPTITLALKSLADQGRLVRRKDGSWFLHDVGDLAGRGPDGEGDAREQQPAGAQVTVVWPKPVATGDAARRALSPSRRR